MEAGCQANFVKMMEFSFISRQIDTLKEQKDRLQEEISDGAWTINKGIRDEGIRLRQPAAAATQEVIADSRQGANKRNREEAARTEPAYTEPQVVGVTCS